MFEINLLLKPGLQIGAPQGAQGEIELDQEDPLIDRLRSRGGTFTTRVVGGEEDTTEVKQASWFWRLVFVGAISYLAYWTFYQGGLDRLKYWRDTMFGTTISQTKIVEIVEPLHALESVKLASQVLGSLSDSAQVDYLDVGGGLLLYRVSGKLSANQLTQLNIVISGYRAGDVVPFNHNGQSGWGGAVAYQQSEGFERWDPPTSDYDQFFRNLRQSVTSGGGSVMLTAAGLLTPGEYVIGGDMSLLLDHLTEVVTGPRYAIYHRVSLLRQSVENANRYQLRVVFNLVGGEDISPPASLQAGTGA